MTSTDSQNNPTTVATTSPSAAAAEAADLLGVWTMTDWTTPAGRRPVQFDATVRFTANGDGTGTLTTSGCDNVTYGITFGDAQSFVVGAIIGEASLCANPFDEGQRLGGIFNPEQRVSWHTSGDSLVLSRPTDPIPQFAFTSRRTRPEDPSSMSTEASALTGTKWQLTELVNELGFQTAQSSTTVGFSTAGDGTGTVTIEGCVNQTLSLRYAFNRRLTFDPVEPTEATCADGSGDGAQLLKLFGSQATYWTVDGTTLSILGEDGFGFPTFVFDQR